MIRGVSSIGKVDSAFSASAASARKTDAPEKTSNIQPEKTQELQTKDDAAVKGDVYAKDEQEQEKEYLTEGEVSDLSDKLNEFMQKMNTDIRFEYHEKLDRLCMQVIDRKNDEIIKEFPPEKMIKVLEGLHDWVGLILDKEA